MDGEVAIDEEEQSRTKKSVSPAGGQTGNCVCATVSMRRLIPTSTSRPPPSNLRDVVHDTSAAASDAPPSPPSLLATAAAASAVGEADVTAWGGTVGRRRHPAGSRRYLPSTCAGSGAHTFELSCSREYVTVQ